MKDLTLPLLHQLAKRAEKLGMKLVMNEQPA